MIRTLRVALLFGLVAGTGILLNCRDEMQSAPDGVNSAVETEQIVSKYFQYINEEKLDEFFALFNPEVEFHAPPNINTKGVENVRPFYNMILMFASDHVDTPVQLFVSGNRAAVFIQAEAGFSNGRKVSFNASDWFTVEQGKITSLHIFFDVFALLSEFSSN